MHVLAFILKGPLFSEDCDKQHHPPRLPSTHGAMLMLWGWDPLHPSSGQAPTFQEAPPVQAQAEPLGGQRGDGEPSTALPSPCTEAWANMDVSLAESCKHWRTWEHAIAHSACSVTTG